MPGWPSDAMLEAGSGSEEIAGYLNLHVPGHFGVSKLDGALEFARGIMSWFSARRKDTTVLK